jgi:hypothetical protein
MKNKNLGLGQRSGRENRRDAGSTKPSRCQLTESSMLSSRTFKLVTLN